MNINNTFKERLKDYFGNDADTYIELLDKPASHGFFVNTNKDNKENILKTIDFKFNESGLNDNAYLTDYDSIGKTVAYNLGLIYPQDAESSLSSSLVSLNDIKLIVDMCAAPGGKSINIANTYPDALLISNEVNHTRASILASNLERMGIDKSIVTNMDTGYLADKLQGNADLVILDAPCSGEGMIRKYPEIMDNYNTENINSLAKLQEELLDNAYKLCKKDGYILYSTCTYALEEDENQVSNFISKYDVELIPLKFKYNYSKLDGTIKLCPLNGTEGQFIALLKKKGDTDKAKIKYLVHAKNKTVDDFIKENLTIDKYSLYSNGDNYYLSLNDLPDLGKGTIRNGIYLGELKKGRFEPAHNFYRANSLIGKYINTIELNKDEYFKYINGSELPCLKPNDYYLITYMNYQLGYGKIADNRLKNKYPKGLRTML